MITTYLCLQAALFLLLFGGFFQVQKFLHVNSSISCPGDLDAFKTLVRVNMYVALISIIIGIPTILLSMIIGYSYGIFGLGIVLVISIPQVLFARYVKSQEYLTRSMDCSSHYADEYHRIGQSWSKKALPDF